MKLLNSTNHHEDKDCKLLVIILDFIVELVFVKCYYITLLEPILALFLFRILSCFSNGVELIVYSQSNTLVRIIVFCRPLHFKQDFWPKNNKLDLLILKIVELKECHIFLTSTVPISKLQLNLSCI